jgi:hypothetical protein
LYLITERNDVYHLLVKKSRVFPNSKALPSLSKHALLRLWHTTKDEEA